MNSRSFNVDLKLQCLHKLRLSSGFLILLINPFLTINQSWADSWQNSVSTQLTTAYDSNPTMNPTNPEGISRALLTPGYVLTGELADNQSVKIGVAMEIVRTSNEILSPNRNSPTLFADWSRQFETTEIELGSKYAENSTRVLGGIDATAAVDSTRTNRTLLFKVNKALNERNTLATSGSYESVSYKGGTFTDYSTRTADLTYSYLWNERITPFIKLTYLDTVPINGGPVTSLYITSLGLNWKLSDSWESNLLAGTSRNNNSEMATQSIASLKYQDQKSQLSLNASQQTIPSGIGGLVSTITINGGGSYTISEINKIGIDALWQKSELITDVVLRTEGVWIQTELNPLWILRTYYQHNTIDRGNDYIATSYILGLNFAYSHPDF